MADMPPWDCAHVRDLLPDEVAGALSPSDHAALMAHVRGCDDCAAELAAWQQLAATARSEPPAAPMAPFEEAWAGIASRLGEAGPSIASLAARRDSRMLTERNKPFTRTPPQTPLPRRQPRTLPAVAAALIVTLLGAGIFGLLAHRTGATTSVSTTPTTATTTGCPKDSVNATIPTGAYLTDMAMISPDEGWAVGGVPAAPSTAVNPLDRTLIMHYSSCKWSEITSPSSANIPLYSTSFGSPNDGWAVGSTLDANDVRHSLVLHFTGGRWQVASLPNIPAAQGSVETVAMYSADDGWMLVDHGKANFGLMQVSLLHYAHGTWSPVSSAYESPSVLAPVGPNDVWVAGETGYEKAFLAHYANGTWHDTGLPTNTVISTLHMNGANNGWAGALQYTPSTLYVSSITPVALRYDGSSWKQVNIAPQAKAQSQSIEMLSDAEGWIFSFEPATRHYPGGTPIGNCCAGSSQYYSGGTWSTKPLPLADLGPVTALTRAGPGDYWAISYHNNGAASKAVIFHYTGSAWYSSAP